MDDVADADGELTELVGLVDAAADEREWEHQIAAAVVGEQRDNVVRQQLADAFRFHARDERKHPERFGPMFTFEGGATVPAPLAVFI